MLYYTENVIDVSALCEYEKMRRDMEIFTKIRYKVLDECYAIKGYLDLTNAEKAKIFNQKLAEYAKLLGKTLGESVINCLRELAVNALKAEIGR